MTVYGEITYVFYLPQNYDEMKQFEAENDLSIYRRTEDTIAVRYNYKTNATYPYESKADRKTENSSEKPNNCEHITEDGVTCAKYPACDDCLDNPLNKVKGSERLVKGSEQRAADRKTEPSNSEKPNNCEVKNYCDDCLYTDTCDSKEFFYACTSKATISKIEQVEEPTEITYQNCSDALLKMWMDNVLTDAEYNRIMDKLNNAQRKDEPQIYCDTCGLNKKCGVAFTEEARHCQNESRFGKDEPQTDCAWK